MSAVDAGGSGERGRELEQLFEQVLGRLHEDAPPELDADAERLFQRLARLGRPGLDPEVRLERADPEAASSGRARLQPLRKVAEGGMGEIWAVWDADLRRTLAMKLARAAAHPTGAGSTTALHRLLEEAQVTGQLEHPAIVPVHELGLDAQGRVYFTMQLVEGRDLGRILPLVRRGEEGWTPTRAVGVLVRVCEAVAYAHAKGVLHRDLKPSNVMVGRFGEVYVMDWGLAKVRGREDARDLRPRTEAMPESEPVRTDRGDRRESDPATPLRTLDGSVVGTPAYMPPEQARGEVERIDERSDVHSLGAILYHLLAGAPPYAGSGTPLEILAAVVAGPPAALGEIAPDAPPELVAVCDKAMARAPERRYASADALRADLQAWLDGRVVAAHESGAWAELRKWVRRNRAVAGLATALVLALVIGTVVSTTQSVLATERGRELERALGPVDLVALQELEEAADVAWPLEPARLEGWRGWLLRARDLAGRLELHRQRLARAPSGSEPELAKLVAGLERLVDPERGPIDGRSGEHGPGVARRVALVEELARRQAAPEAVSARARAVEDIRRSERYDGLALELPWAFEPLGPDPESGLFEFADLRTGVAPERDPRSGRLAIVAESAVVLVLIPAGAFWMGAQSGDPEGPNHVDPELLEPAYEELPDERPPRRLELRAPFFLAKHELTQAQWRRATAEEPSGYGAAQGFDGRHPVENVTWAECARFARWFGWELPTEAQWEYAARAGTEWPWSTGPDKESLRGAANLLDRAYAEAAPEIATLTRDWPEHDDGFAFHAPVGSFEPNPFGLHDVHGNVSEWCLDLYMTGYERGTWRASDGLRLIDEEERPPGGLHGAVLRGGCFLHTALRLRSSSRTGKDRQHYRVHALGFRPCARVPREL